MTLKKPSFLRDFLSSLLGRFQGQTPDTPPAGDADPPERIDPTIAPDPMPPAPAVPSPEPPVVKAVEEERRDKQQEAEENTPSGRPLGLKSPPFDEGIEWLVRIDPAEDRPLTLSAIETLRALVTGLKLELPAEIFCRSTDDGLWYPADLIVGPADCAVGALILANRGSTLDAVRASGFLQAFEHVGTQEDAAVTSSGNVMEAVSAAREVAAFIRYYDCTVEILILPGAAAVSDLSERVAREASTCGFISVEDGFAYYSDPHDRVPLMKLKPLDEKPGVLRLCLDVPLVNTARGDIGRFFQTANQLANLLGGSWSDCSFNPVDAGGALLIEEDMTKHIDLMAASGVRAGSERAKKIFALGRQSESTEK